MEATGYSLHRTGPRSLAPSPSILPPYHMRLLNPSPPLTLHPPNTLCPYSAPPLTPHPQTSPPRPHRRPSHWLCPPHRLVFPHPPSFPCSSPLPYPASPPHPPTLPGLIAVPATGYVLHHTGSWSLAFALAAVHNVAGAALWARWAGGERLKEDGAPMEEAAVHGQVAAPQVVTAPVAALTDGKDGVSGSGNGVVMQQQREQGLPGQEKWQREQDRKCEGQQEWQREREQELLGGGALVLEGDEEGRTVGLGRSKKQKLA